LIADDEPDMREISSPHGFGTRPLHRHRSRLTVRKLWTRSPATRFDAIVLRRSDARLDGVHWSASSIAPVITFSDRDLRSAALQT